MRLTLNQLRSSMTHTGTMAPVAQAQTAASEVNRRGRAWRMAQVKPAMVTAKRVLKWDRRLARLLAARMPPAWNARAVTELPTVVKDCTAEIRNIWYWKIIWWLAAWGSTRGWSVRSVWRAASIGQILLG